MLRACILLELVARKRTPSGRTRATCQQVGAELSLLEGSNLINSELSGATRSPFDRTVILEKKMAYTIGGLAKLSLASYENPPSDVDDWRFVSYFGTLGSEGFFAALFRDEAERYVFAIRGTDDAWDVIDDAGILMGTITSQMTMARTALAEVRRLVPHPKKLALTGHSLGGGVAALLALERQLYCATFNAPGTWRSYGTSFAAKYRYLPVVQQLLAITAPLTTSGSKIINIRASFDVVSVGTGPRLGRVETISVRGCEPTAVMPAFDAKMHPTLRQFQAQAKPSPQQQLNQIVQRSGRYFADSTANYILCQHSMSRMVDELAFHPEYNRELSW